MDVAVFVGFAASGPLHLPVMVEDPSQFRDVFGDDLPLVWDERQSERVNAHLAPAVRAFFANGGRRCWVIRVAAWRDRSNQIWPSKGDYLPATANRFPIPGLVLLSASDSSPGHFLPSQAYADARSEGSWSDVLQVGTTLLRQPLGAARIWMNEDKKCVIALSSASVVVPGDLLRFTFTGANDLAIYLPVQEVKTSRNAPSGSPPAPPVPKAGEVWAIGTVGLGFTAQWPKSAVPFEPGSPPGASINVVAWSQGIYRLDAELRRLSIADSDHIVMVLAVCSAETLNPCSFMRLDLGGSMGQELWLNIREVRPVERSTIASSPPGVEIEITGSGLWRSRNPQGVSSPPASEAGFVERLTFEIIVQSAPTGQQSNVEQSWKASDLSFVPGSDRYWADLPSDERLFAQELDSELRKKPQLRGLWADVRHPRFPVSGPWAGEATIPKDTIFFIPLGMSDTFPKREKLCPALPSSRSRLERDGLARFSGDLFLDPALSGTITDRVMSTADFLRYESHAPRRLTGIHAALEIDEATLIAVPDAVQRTWQPGTGKSPPLPKPECPKEPTEVCRPPRPEGVKGQFKDLNRPASPVLEISTPDERGGYVVMWKESPESAVPKAGLYRLEEAMEPDFSDAVEVYAGSLNEKAFTRGEGIYFYRVRGESSGGTGPWSEGQAVRVSHVLAWQLEPPTGDTEVPEGQRVHQALLRLCAARGDLLAVLSLPVHYREDEALAYVTRLNREFGNEADRTLSFGALYHPWLVERGATETITLRSLPPEGAVCGMIARRALLRGAWIAPANETYDGPAAMTPRLGPERLLELQEGRINIIRNESRGFLSLSAATLSKDPLMRPIHVRRLLILLRRLAVREGARYVFEPNDDAFRRMVQRGFESLLDGLFMRGAFAGATPQSSYRVDTGPTINTPQSLDLGRFIVELRVAPAQALQFITIRLIQTGASGLKILEG